MKKVAVIYSFNTTNSKLVAKKIVDLLSKSNAKEVNAEELTEELFKEFDNFVIMAPTWFDGELPNYWDEFVPALQEIDLKGKKIALAGLGNQIEYPENFIDAVGLLADIFEEQGAEIVGFTSTKGYNFEGSLALRKNKFCGLAIDLENMSDKLEDQLKNWSDQITGEFN